MSLISKIANTVVDTVKDIKGSLGIGEKNEVKTGHKYLPEKSSEDEQISVEFNENEVHTQEELEEKLTEIEQQIMKLEQNKNKYSEEEFTQKMAKLTEQKLTVQGQIMEARYNAVNNEPYENMAEWIEPGYPAPEKMKFE